MSRKPLLGLGALALVLLTGWILWPRQSNNTVGGLDDTVKIVRGSRTGNGVRQTNTPVAPGSPISETANGSASVQVDTRKIPEDGEMQASLPDPAFDPRTLYKRVRSERGVQAALVAVPYIAHGDGLRVSCASTLCEVHGSISADTSPENTNVAMQALQGDAFRKSIAASGLDILTTSFGGNGKVANYTIYAKRR